MKDYSSLYLKVRAVETVFCMVSHLGLWDAVLGGCSLHAALDIGLRQQQKMGHPLPRQTPLLASTTSQLHNSTTPRLHVI